jgi:hypothetical protein
VAPLMSHEDIWTQLIGHGLCALLLCCAGMHVGRTTANHQFASYLSQVCEGPSKGVI